MNIAALVIVIVLCLGMSIVPIFELIGFLDGLDLVLYNETLVVSIQAGICFAAMIAIFILRPEFGWAGRIFGMLLTPISLCNALCFINSSWTYSIFFGIFWSCCVFAIYMRFVPDGFFKAASAVVSVLLAIALVVIYITVVIFQPIIATRTVQQSFESPNKELIAEAMTVETAFSEKTEVRIKAVAPHSDTLLGEYYLKTVSLYEGEDAHESETIKVIWKDNMTVIINNTEYKLG